MKGGHNTGKTGKFDIRGLKELQQKLGELKAPETFADSCTKEVAKEMLRSLRSNTPVQKGTLRRGWTTKSLQRAGDTHRIEIINPVSYATYVEYGHRTPDHRKWVKGRFMMTRSEREVNRMAPAIVEREMKKYLGDIWK